MNIVGGILAMLLGVLLGAILTGRSQDSSWTRDRLAFLNAARRTIAKDAAVIERLVSRPSLRETRAQIAEMFSE